MSVGKDDLNTPVDGMDSIKSFSRGTMLVFVTLLLATVVACDLAMEMNILASTSGYFLPSKASALTNDVDDATMSNDSFKTPSCSPRTVNVSDIEYRSNHRYYTLLKEAKPQAPPIFENVLTVLCNDSVSKDIGYKYCLPISGRKDVPFCTGADRMDLLTQHSSQSRCYASVLHLLLVEVYEELSAFNRTPIVIYGSLLGAVRNQSMIPFTEDTDIAYTGQLHKDNDVGQALMAKGYHFFFLDIWRVCVAPTHPLAATLYDSQRVLAQDFLVPYVDLYAMEKLSETTWGLEKFGDSLLPTQVVEPFSHVTINGLPFDTVRDPQFVLTKMYGTDYMIPKPRH